MLHEMLHAMLHEMLHALLRALRGPSAWNKCVDGSTLRCSQLRRSPRPNFPTSGRWTRWTRWPRYQDERPWRWDPSHELGHSWPPADVGLDSLTQLDIA